MIDSPDALPLSEYEQKSASELVDEIIGHAKKTDEWKSQQGFMSFDSALRNKASQIQAFLSETDMSSRIHELPANLQTVASLIIDKSKGAKGFTLDLSSFGYSPRDDEEHFFLNLYGDNLLRVDGKKALKEDHIYYYGLNYSISTVVLYNKGSEGKTLREVSEVTRVLPEEDKVRLAHWFTTFIPKEWSNG